MTSKDTNYLLDMLDKTHSELRAKIKGVNLEIPVYEEGEWQIRDVIGHIAIWDREVVSELYSTSGEYDLMAKVYIPDEEDVGQFLNAALFDIPGISRTLTTMTFRTF